MGGISRRDPTTIQYNGISVFCKITDLFLTSSNDSRIYETSMSKKINIRSFFHESLARKFNSSLVTLRLVPCDAHKQETDQSVQSSRRNVQEKYWKLRLLRIRPLRRLQMSATNYTATRLYIPEEQKTQIQSYRSLRTLNILYNSPQYQISHG